MKALRLLAAILGLVTMLVEGYRSWGVGRPVAFWMDDVVMGSCLIGGAIALSRETLRRRAFFSGAWGIAVGMFYGSFFGKVFSPQTQHAGNLSLGLLTALTGLGFGVAIVGLVASVVLPFRESS